MKALVLCTTLLCAAPAFAQLAPQDKDGNLEFAASSLERRIIPFALKCDTLEQLRSIIKAAVRGGREASNQVFTRLNAGQKRQVCRSSDLKPAEKPRMRPLEAYEAVEAFPGELSDLVVVSIKEKSGKVRYMSIRRIRGRGYTL